MKHIISSLCMILLLAACGPSAEGQVSIPAPEMTGVAATLVAIQQPKLFDSYPSPDGIWAVDVIIYDCVNTGGVDENAYEQLRLVRISGGEQRIADDQLRYCGGLGTFGFWGRFWSPDSRYFYYSDAREGAPDGCGYWVPPIIRLDTTTLSKEYLGAGPLSPNGEKIATWLGQELVVWDVNGGEIGRFLAFVSDAPLGQIVWSPDNQALVYVQWEAQCPVSGNFYLVWVDLKKSEQTLLLESDAFALYGIDWNLAGELSLFDKSGQEWRYDFVTQELTPMP